MRAALLHLMAGQDLYAAYPALHPDFFKYSPTFAFLFAPFAVLPLTDRATCCGPAPAHRPCIAGIMRALPPAPAGVALALAWLAVVGDLQRAQSNALVRRTDDPRVGRGLERREPVGAAVGDRRRRPS